MNLSHEYELQSIFQPSFIDMFDESPLFMSQYHKFSFQTPQTFTSYQNQYFEEQNSLNLSQKLQSEDITMIDMLKKLNDHLNQHTNENIKIWGKISQQNLQLEQSIFNEKYTDNNNQAEETQNIDQNYNKMAQRLKKKIDVLFKKQKNFENAKFAYSKNMPRFFVKLIDRYSQQYGCKIQINKDLKQSILKKTGVNMKEFRQILKGQGSILKRQTVAKLLRKTLKIEVIQKKYIKDRLCYINSSKMFALRCQSQHLICRFKTK